MTKAPDILRQVAGALQRGDLTAASAIAEAGLRAMPREAALLGFAALAALRQGQPEVAVDFLRRQLAETPQDLAARFNLATTLAGLGSLTEAAVLAEDYAGHAKMARLAGYLSQQQGQGEAAIIAYREAVRVDPDDWESWNNLGNCYTAAGDTEGAIEAFENAINRAPFEVPEIFHNLSEALGAVENREARLRTAQEAARRFPDNASVRIEHGLALVSSGRNMDAIDVLRAAAVDEAQFGEAHLELGLLYEHTNQLDELDALIASSAAERDNAGFEFLKAWSLRRHNRFEEAQALADGIPASINPVRTAQLRGEIADRLGDQDEAFRQFTLMNEASVAATRPFSSHRYRSLIAAQTAAMTLPLGPPLALIGTDPIFLVGFPRSGTTLLDTLLSGLPVLEVFEEMPMLATVDSEFPALALSTDAQAIAAARARYFELAAQGEASAGIRRIVDKHPLHMTKLPLINRLFPAAHILMVERHPCDVVLSCFMANFQLNTAMRSFTDLDEAARTYDAVFANFTRACELSPVALHRVRYERMVADLAGEMRPLLEFLGLEWHDAVLDNQASAAVRGTVRTASYAQIGQPLYTRAAFRWERYREQLAQVLPVLEPWIDRLGYSG